MKTLDLQTFPLEGLALIEASAGTGKTYTLANLYLRYLLEKQFSVEQILVVTFTEAATQELKDRIRLRIGELVQVFINDGEHRDGESSDAELKAFYEKSEYKEADLVRLRLAERQIDQAEIYTIHGFCQKMLKEYALDANFALQQTLVEDMRPVILQHLEDFWRKQVMTLPKPQVAYVYERWPGPEGLLQALQPLMNRRPERILPPLTGDLSDWQQSFSASRDWHVALKNKTLEHWQDVYELVSQAPLKRLNDKLKWLGIIREWAEDSHIDFSLPGNSRKPNLLAEFTTGAIAEYTKAKQTAPEHNFFEYLAGHLVNQPAELKHAFVIHAYHALNEQIDLSKRQQGLLSFDDLILRLAGAIEIHSADKSSAAKQLIGRIQQRYDMALIDEFQDTDKAQYGIFSTLFGPLAGESAKGLVLIGDPKQAIYAFRGGDIATYLLAKNEVESHPRGEIFTMATNWRSSPDMIAAVNHLFAQRHNPFMAEAIPFVEVEAGRKGESVNSSTAMHISQLDVISEADEKLKKESLVMGLTNHCVGQICDLLAEGHYQSADIAILVRSATEAELIKQGLSAAGIVASFEGKASVYESEEALAILWLLSAVAEPGNESLIRRCLAEPFFGFKDEHVQRMNNDVIFLGEIFQTFKELHTLWLSKGVLAMIREAMSRLEVFKHWQAYGLANAGNDWERRLTNINQLAEILQQQARTHRSQPALLRWFREQLFERSMADDETRLRLESDEKLIRIITIHKSKGLEYPVVFLPYLFSTRGADEAWFYDEQGRLSLDLAKSEGTIVKAEQERMAEDMRLLYVALTRAKYQCFIGTCAYQSRSALSLGLAQTAWGYLCLKGGTLEGKEKLDDARFSEALQDMASISKASISVSRFTLEQIEQTPQFIASESSPESVSLNARMLQRDLHSSWKVTSFTGLMHEHHTLSAHGSHGLIAPAPQLPAFESDAIHILNFPKGSRAGTFLHTLFEHIEFEHGSLLPELQSVYSGLSDYITRQLEISQLVEPDAINDWAEYLSEWLLRVLSTPLESREAEKAFALSNLPTAQYVVEMAFHFSIDQLSAAKFNELIRKHWPQNASEEEIQFSQFHGHMKGAIDLVFEHEGQFFVLDYKSNYLGDHPDQYHQDALHLAINDHRYDVQYLIYTLALHRYLKHRLGERYDYEQHMGGVYYLFLRGLSLATENESQQTPGVYFVKPPYALIQALDESIGTEVLPA